VAEASTFLSNYNANLASFGAWLASTVAADFPNTTQILMLPGWGERPGMASQGTASLLSADLPELNMGTDWSAQLAADPRPGNTIAYTTWIDATSGGTSSATEDPADYLASLVQGTSFKMGGENTGGGDLSTLTLSVGRASRLHFTIMNWLAESQVFDPTAFLAGFPSSSAITPQQFEATISGI